MQRSTPRSDRVLLVEDDQELASPLAAELRHAGHDVRVAGDGLQGLAAAREWRPDVIVLDLRLPFVDGLEVCRRVRRNSGVPILIVTARDSVGDRVRGLDAGADDYLTKPFSLEELLARVRAGLRRGQLRRPGERLTVCDLEVDVLGHRVTRGGQPIELTPREFELLEFLFRHQGQVLSRPQIFTEVWGYDYLGESNVIDVYVRALRRKIDDGFDPPLIETVRGVGYVLRPPP